MSINKKNVIDFFLSHCPQFKLEDIKKIQKIHSGYTNFSYKLLTKNNEFFQVRFSKENDLVDRNNEKNIINLVGFNKYFLYLDERGNAIKKWIFGKTLLRKNIDEEFINLLLTEIDYLHSIKYNEQILKHNYTDVLKNKKISKKYLNIYSKCLNILDDKKWVLSHNDLNLQNMIFNHNKIIFIDYEWSRINHPLWDIVNFVRETKLNNFLINKIILKLQVDNLDFYKMLYICLCFAHDWALSNKLNLKIFIYKINNFLQLRKIYKFLKKFNI
ncbi:MAG: phosphotransferase [Ureaplasma sp.]|nr:phosphotransferase [Ureaplasma sp.]